MRFTVSSTELSNKLAALSRVINNKSSLPILGDFLFNGASISTLPIGKVASIIQEAGQTATDKTSVERKVVNSRKVAQTSTVELLTDSITLQSDNSNAERGYQQQDQTQEEGNNTQRGRCKARRGVFRTEWPGGGYERIRKHGGDVFRKSRLARHRRRGEGILLEEEKTGTGGRWRAGTPNQSSDVRCTGQRYDCQPIEPTFREQSSGTVLSVYKNDNRRA